MGEGGERPFISFQSLLCAVKYLKHGGSGGEKGRKSGGERGGKRLSLARNRRFLSAAKPTDQGEESVVLVVVVIVRGFGGTVFQSPMYTQNGCIQRKLFSKWVYPENFFLQNGCIQRKGFFFQNGCIQGKLFFKMGVSRELFSSKWVHPENFFLQNGCIQRKLFFKMGVSRENFSSKWVHPEKTFLQIVYSQKTFAAKLMHQDKTLLKNGCFESLSFTEFRKRIILSVKVTLHVKKVSLLM